MKYKLIYLARNLDGKLAYAACQIDGIETWGCGHCVWQWKMGPDGYWVPEIYNG